MRSLVLLLLVGAVALAQWPEPKHAMDAYDFVQKQRSEAEKLWAQKDPKGIAMLEDAMRYLEQPLVRDLATGNFYLAMRLANIRADLAKAYAAAGEPERAVATLKTLLPSHEWAQYLETNKRYASLRGRPDFEAVIRGLRLYDKYWDTPALGTPYQPNLTDTEKLAGLSKLWSDVKYNFAYPEKLIVLDWDALYMQWIPKVLATRTTHDYYRQLMAFCAKLSDGHTNVFYPRELDIDNTKPPMRTGLVQGHLMILDVPSAKLRKLGVIPGLEIVEVDGQNAIEYGESLAPFHSMATPQDAQNRTFWYAFLRGPKTRAVKLTLRDAGGKTSTVAVPRDGYDDVEWGFVKYTELPGNIGYVALNEFSSNEAVKQWNALLPKILATAGLILDVRLNSGGSSNIGFEILASLVTKPFLGSRQVMRMYNPTDRAVGTQMQFTEVPASETQPRGQGYGTKPIVVLTGPATYSAAEDFMVAWKNSKRGQTIGEPTGGSTGQPLFITLPGGGSARICTKRDTFPDGTEWVGKGIHPDIVVRPTVADVQAGRDPVLEAAIKAVTTK